jgi:site-specific recombinase XerD
VTSTNTDPPELKKRRDRGDHGISWDKTNKCYVGTLSLGNDSTGKRIRRTVTGKNKTEAKDKLDKLKDEIKAGIRTPATYTVKQCVQDWIESLKLDPGTIASYRGQAQKWIYPKLGARKLKDLKAAEVERFLNDLGKLLGKRSLMMIKSTLRRSIRRAQVNDLIRRNVAELTDLPEGQPGRPSRAMTQQQAALVLATATGTTTLYTTVVKIGKYAQAATHAATDTGALACGTKPRREATQVGTDLAATTCRSCRPQIGLDGDGPDLLRLEALFVLSLTLGMRPGELRGLRWDHLDLDKGIIHVWRSARRGGDVKTPKSRRSLILPNRAINALRAHRKRQAAERLTVGEGWQDNNLVFCHPDGHQYTRDALNWRFAKMTRRAGLGHWHAHEARHTAVSIMSKNGVPIQDISDTMGHKSTHVTETVYRHVIVPAIQGGASVMDDVFGA